MVLNIELDEGAGARLDALVERLRLLRLESKTSRHSAGKGCLLRGLEQLHRELDDEEARAAGSD